MRYRVLGRTGLRVSEIGFGTEHLTGPQAAVEAAVGAAIDAGVNYFDMVLSGPEYRDYYTAAFGDRRERLVIAGHLGNAFVDGQSITTRDPALCEASLHDLLRRINYVDVLMLQFVDEAEDYAAVTGPGGLLEMARRFQAQGKARYLGMSSHMTPAALRAVEDGLIDVLMFSINPAFDTLPGYLPRVEALWERAHQPAEASSAERKALYHACFSRGVGLVAMKAYGAGFLLNPALPHPLTPVQCLQYALDQPGVCTVVPGVRSVEELRAALRLEDAAAEERDYGAALSGTRWNVEGACMYCNHCLPCPAGIDVAAMARLIDAAARGITPALRQAYAALDAGAAACLDCGECSARCPFRVDVSAKMRRGVEVFG